MKILATAFCALNVGMLFSSAIYGQPATGRPRFQIEIHTTGERGPTYTVTNLSGKRVSACVLEISSSSQRARKSKTVWDALIQGQPPIEPGASISQYLPHVVGGPLPDKVEVIAVVWVDGETFGQPVWVNNILKNRGPPSTKMQLRYYSRDWTRIGPAIGICRLSATSQTRARSIPSGPR